MAGPHAHDEKPDAEDAKKKKAEADAAKDDYAEEMKKKFEEAGAKIDLN